MSILEAATRKGQQAVSGVLKNTAASLLKDDLTALNNFCHLIRGLLAYSPAFFKSNAIWWTCNYAALTISLHTFAFWLASTSPEAEFIACGHNSSQLEARLRACLDMLRAIGASSAMSVKAHRCLRRHLDFLKTSCESHGEDLSLNETDETQRGPLLQQTTHQVPPWFHMPSHTPRHRVICLIGSCMAI
ncbi:hypothetical protein LB505_012307 [Fusarium chuoi]|nr:hypothetical protein LB505_012307 [Fusarium chuoi]